MEGIGIVCQSEFTDADSFIKDLAARLVGILLLSDEPVETSAGTMSFEPVPSAECDRVTFRHWEGREFPVACRGEDLESGPRARLFIHLEYRLFEIEEDLFSAIAHALGMEGLEQKYLDW